MKKGFTLIEVMVVIVILGVLAAVAVPKLFGMVAKAKASEVPVAAGTYAKLQDAFYAEKSTAGNWKNIGYVAPGNGATTNFCYSEGVLSNDTATTDELASGIIGWGAKSLVSMNECGAGAWWSVEMTAKGDNGINYAQNISYAPCMALTTNWKEGTTLTGNCENAGLVPKPESNNTVETPIIDKTEKPTVEKKEDTKEEAQKQQAAQSAVQAAKEAFTSCTGKTCTKEEHDRLKKAWDDEKEKCKQLYGNAVCGE